MPARKSFGTLLYLLFLVGLIGATVFALLTPKDVPAETVLNRDAGRKINLLIESSSGASGTRAFDVPATDVNDWLVSTVTLQEGEDSPGLLKPVRVYAVPGTGEIRVGLVMKTPLGNEVYFEGDFVPVRADGQYRLQSKRYSVGRLPLPSHAGWLAERQLQGLMVALDDPLRRLARASQIGITPETISLRWSTSEP